MGAGEPALRHLHLFEDEEIPEPITLFDDYAGRGPAAKQHRMGIADHLGDHRLMIKYSSKFTPAQYEVFDNYFRPKNEAFLNAKLAGKARTRWHYQRYIKNYLRCVIGLDESIGLLLDYLEKADLVDNTVVIYSSDQGFYLGEHGWFDKRWIYEESLSTPFVVRWPSVVEHGSTNSDIVSNLDFAETFLDIAGADTPMDMQGSSLIPLLNGRTPSDFRETFYYHYYESGGHGVPAHYGVIDDRYKLVHFYEPRFDAWELYDRKSDPQELDSVYDDRDYAGVVKRLKTELRRLQREYQVPRNDRR